MRRTSLLFRPSAGAASLLLSALFATAAISTTPVPVSTQQSAPAQNAVSAQSGAPASKVASRTSHSARVESRISELRSKLKVTPDQEQRWNELTQVMRDNAGKLDQLTQTRAQNAGRMTAIEDLQSYSQIADAHAEGLKKFIPAFQALYDSMSDAQKKQADALFEGRSRMASSRSTAKHHS